MGFVVFFKNMVSHMAHIMSKTTSVGRYEILLSYIRLKLKQIVLVKILRFTLSSTRLFGFSFYFFDYYMFLYLFEEIFVKEEYYFVAKRRDPLIIDCGSNIGLSLVYFKKLYPDSRVMAFEPDKKTFEVLRKNVQLRGLRDVALHNSAVYDSEGAIHFYFDPSEPGSPRQSLEKGRISTATEEVPAVQLSKYIDGEVDLLKMDIEGSELIVIEDLVRHDKLKLVDQMVVEYHHHIGPDDDRFSRMLNILETNGFGYQITTALAPPFQPRLFQDILVYAYRKPE